MDTKHIQQMGRALRPISKSYIDYSISNYIEYHFYYIKTSGQAAFRKTEFYRNGLINNSHIFIFANTLGLDGVD